ncbi:hypothetical protein AHF37_06218 [Paragonimus kellicotti]|nr:hypothetical protein AHF37_06218 [Paragonimus kellicotti]
MRADNMMCDCGSGQLAKKSTYDVLVVKSSGKPPELMSI